MWPPTMLPGLDMVVVGAMVLVVDFGCAVDVKRMKLLIDGLQDVWSSTDTLYTSLALDRRLEIIDGRHRNRQSSQRLLHLIDEGVIKRPPRTDRSSSLPWPKHICCVACYMTCCLGE